MFADTVTSSRETELLQECAKLLKAYLFGPPNPTGKQDALVSSTVPVAADIDTENKVGLAIICLIMFCYYPLSLATAMLEHCVIFVAFDCKFQ